MKRKVLIFFSLIMFCGAVFAVDPPPLAMLKNTSSQMIHELDKNLSQIKRNDRLVYNLVNRILVPHFALAAMSQGVVGRENWQQATPALQQQFIAEFTRYVIRTYSSALQSYDGETIRFYPIRGYNPSVSRVQVNSDILQKDGPSINLQYRLLNNGGNWLIYDFSVDGISIVQNYRSQFAGVLRQGGLTKLVQQLQQRNAGFR